MFKSLKIYSLPLIVFLPFIFSINATAHGPQYNQPCNVSQKGYMNVNWNQLNLSSTQQKKINDLDIQWRELEHLVKSKIIRDQQNLKNIIKNPNVQEEKIRNIQRDIMLRQEQLRNEATENFLSKRRILNSKQKIILHKMITD